MENPVIIMGASGLGKVALDIFNFNDILIYCFLDEEESLHNTEINDIIVMGDPTDDGYLKLIGKKCEAFVAVDDKERRKSLTKLLEERRKVVPVNAVHPHTDISKHVKIGNGNLINVGTVINSGTQIGNHCIINSNVVIEYDAVIGDFVQIGAGAIVNAKVQIGDGALIGSGSLISAGVKIGENAQVAPGSVVMQDVEEEQVVFGVPAKSIG